MTHRFQGLVIGLVVLLSALLLFPSPGRAQDAAQVQQSREACREGRGEPRACVAYGLALLNGVTVAEDAAGAARVWRAACDRDTPAACSHLAWVLRRSEGVAHDLPEALRLYLKACEGRVAEACLYAGHMLRDGEGGPADVARAKGRFNYACLYGNGVGCREEAELYYAGGGLRDAMNAYRSACRLQDAVGCGVVAWMASRGEGVDAPDFALAVREYKRACALGQRQSCENLEAWRAAGADHAGYAALIAFEAREAAFPSTLPAVQRYILATAAMQEGRTTLALAGFEALAEEGLADAAFNLGQIYWSGQNGVAMDRPRAVRYFERAANGGHPYGQFITAQFMHSGFVLAQNEIWAIQLMRAAHEAGGIAEAGPIWRAWQNGREAYFDERDRQMREMARENAESAAAAEAANMARIWGLYSSRQNQQENGQVCGTVYRNNQANHECMARETFDRYYNPNR